MGIAQNLTPFSVTPFSDPILLEKDPPGISSQAHVDPEALESPRDTVGRMLRHRIERDTVIPVDERIGKTRALFFGHFHPLSPKLNDSAA